jgi:flagellar motor switch protein FliN/FliY
MTEDRRKLDLRDQQPKPRADAETVDQEPTVSAAEPAALPARRQEGADLQAVYDIPVQLSAVLGKAIMPVSQLLRLGRGAVVELDRRVGESIDILVNNRLVARGEVVIVDDHLGVTMTEIIKSEP